MVYLLCIKGPPLFPNEAGWWWSSWWGKDPVLATFYPCAPTPTEDITFPSGSRDKKRKNGKSSGGIV